MCLQIKPKKATMKSLIKACCVKARVKDGAVLGGPSGPDLSEKVDCPLPTKCYFRIGK